MRTHEFNSAQITRAGFEYQDLVAIELLLQLYQNPDNYEWAELDSSNSDFKSIDDIVLKYSESNSYKAFQVKFTVDPNRYELSIDWLTYRDKSKPKSTSLLNKWASRLQDLKKDGANVSARLITNRPFSDDLKENITSENKIDFSKLSKEHQNTIANEIGGLEEATLFFQEFIFEIHPHIQVDLNSLEDKKREVRNKLVPHYTDDHGWRILNDKVKSWSMHKNDPLPDGKIYYKHLKSIIRKGRPTPLIQNFLIPENYVQPSEEFVTTWNNGVEKGQSTNVLWGLPGQGKSTFLSAYAHELKEKKVYIARHHYFLSLAESNSDRFSYDAIENSIIDQIASFLPDEKTPSRDERDNNLKPFIIAASEYALSKGSIFVLIIDGLDHVWREGGSNDQMNHLFMNITFDHEGYSLICGTQKIEERLLPPSLLNKCPIDDWIPLPPLSLENVQNLIEPKIKSSEIKFEENHEYEFADYLKLLLEMCSGNPLVLTYVMEELTQPHKLWGFDEVSTLNPSPSRGVEGYYNNLWNRLPSAGKQALMLMSCVDFHWPNISSISSVINRHISESLGLSVIK